MMRRAALLLSVSMMLALSSQTGYTQEAPVSVLTNRYNLGRTGTNLSETTLNVSNVNPEQFGKLFAREVQGDIYAQPLYVPNVEIPGQGAHNVVYVATMHNMVYAFDADDPALAEPLWEVNLGTPFTQNVYADISGGEDGILSTPVIDPATQTIYLVSRNWENGEALYKLHALDIRTGEPKFGSPGDIRLTFPGTGAGSVDGHVTLDSTNQLQRTGLLLLNGNIYFGFGSNNDQGVWFGWLAAYSVSNVQELTGVWNAAPNGYQAGIWMAGSGIASDGNALFLASANGDFSADVGGSDFAQSVMRIQHSGNRFRVVDYFTPMNWSELSDVDSGLGSTGVVLIPNTGLLVAGGKDGNLYVVDRNQMGRFDPDSNQNVQVFSAGNGRMYCTPVYWENGPGGLPTLYTWNEIDLIRAYNFDSAAQQFNTEAASQSLFRAVGMPLGALGLSANGTDPTTGILWATVAASADTGNRAGAVVAMNATDLTRILWHSEVNPERDAVGILAKFNPITVANGKVYVASFSNRLNVYGLLDNTAA